MIIQTSPIEPSFTPDVTVPGAARIFLGGLWVDYIGTVPTLAEVQQYSAHGVTIAALATAIPIAASQGGQDEIVRQLGYQTQLLLLIANELCNSNLTLKDLED